MGAVERNTERFREAIEKGKLAGLETVWSPADTVADTRYRYRGWDGYAHTLFHREVAGFLTGLGV